MLPQATIPGATWGHYIYRRQWGQVRHGPPSRLRGVQAMRRKGDPLMMSLSNHTPIPTFPLKTEREAFP